MQKGKKYNWMQKLVCIAAAIILMVTPAASVFAAGTYSEPGSYLTDEDYAMPVKCHVISHDDGTVTLIYPVLQGKNKLYIRRVGSDGKDKSVKSVDIPGKIWGGCVFHASDGCYYVATGSDYAGSGKDKVWFFSKFSSSWKLLGQLSLTAEGSNTATPFKASNCDMTMCRKYLIIRTGKLEYIPDKYGVHHQSSSTFIIDTSTMKMPDWMKYYISDDIGAVSHCFNNFVKCINGEIFMVDHGDGSPRAVQLHSYKMPDDSFMKKTWKGTEPEWDSAFKDERSKNLISFCGADGENITGATVDGFEKTKNGFLIAGTSIPHNKVKSEDDFNDMVDHKNIFVSVVKDDKNFSSSLIWLTKYDNHSSFKIKNLKLLKVGENSFYLLYGLAETSDDEKTCYIHIDGSGKVLDKGSLDREFFCTSEPDMHGKVITWGHYVDSYIGAFLVWSSWNISTGKFQVHNVPVDAKAYIDKYELFHSEFPLEVGEEDVVSLGINSKRFAKDPGETDYDLFIAPVVWRSSDTSVVKFAKEESITNPDIAPDELSSEAESKLIAVGPGKATITCEIGQHTEKATVVVKAASGSDDEDDDSSGSSTNSDSSKSSTPAVKQPPKTKISSLKAKGKKAFLVKWKKKKVNGYQIQYARDKKFEKKPKTVTIKKARTTKKKIKKLKSKKTYYVRIRTWTKSGNKKVYSDWSKVKKVKVK